MLVTVAWKLPIYIIWGKEAYDMGQKINPHAMRVGVIKNRNSRWYVDENHEKQNLKFSGYKIGEVKTW